MRKIKASSIFIFFILLVLLTGCVTKQPDSTLSQSPSPTEEPVRVIPGITWPRGQALPHFEAPAETLDTIIVSSLNKDEQIAFSALQGIVNRTKPRIYLVDAGADEGTYTWANTETVNFKSRNVFTNKTKYELFKKYTNDVKGVILYNPSENSHYRNLAGTIAGLKDALPVTQAVYDKMKENGINLDVVVDLTTLTYTTAIDLYNYLYDTYWPECEKRILISANPDTDLHHTRDIQTAVGAAVVYLDCMDPAEKAVYEKFLKDMKAGEALILGWYTSERSGITTATKYGIGTVPADLYISGSVYSGQSHEIQIPEVPSKPSLENKVYITVYISDGDNIQYNQRYMRKLWDQSKSSRGQVPMNWTISPALVDIGPGLLNYYYTTATPNDCFVAGPSGLGYLMPYNTLKEPGADVGSHISDMTAMDGYVKMTQTYMKKAGLRVLTVWDNATDEQRQSYERNFPELLGATVQDFTGSNLTVKSSVVNNRLLFDKLKTAYTGKYNELLSSMSFEIDNWDGKAPKFISYQVSVWGEVKPDQIVNLHKELKDKYGDKFEFVRADHYFELYYEANK